MMPLDETWLALTKLYAIVSIAATCLLIFGLIYLGVKVRGLVRAAKLAPKVAAERSKRTAESLSARGKALASRGRRLGDACRSSFERIAARLRDARHLIDH
jgi:hypothetical protein